MTSFIFDHPKYLGLARSLKDSFKTADPFPHVVIDNFLPSEVIDKVLAEFPKAGGKDWIQFNNTAEKKLTTNHEQQFGPFTRSLLSQFNSMTFLDFLQELTGIEGLISDACFDGGGLHQIEAGGFLKIHADFNINRINHMYRRLNLILYLNKEWCEAYGGHLELWDVKMERCVQKVLPVVNRCVIFKTTSNSYHGHPEPITCPPGVSRKSLALYYFTQREPQEGSHKKHSTLFRTRPNENVDLNVRKRPSHLKRIYRDIVPSQLRDQIKSRMANFFKINLSKEGT